MQNIESCIIYSVSAPLSIHPTASLWSLYPCHTPALCNPKEKASAFGFRSLNLQLLLLKICSSPLLSSKISLSTILLGQVLHSLTKPILSFTSFGKPFMTFYLFIYSTLCLCPLHATLSSWVQTRFPSCCRYLLITFGPLIHSCPYLYHMQLLQLFITFNKNYLFVDFTDCIETHVLSNVCKCAVLKLSLFLFFTKYCVFMIQLCFSYSKKSLYLIVYNPWCVHSQCWPLGLPRQAFHHIHRRTHIRSYKFILMYIHLHAHTTRIHTHTHSLHTSMSVAMIIPQKPHYEHVKTFLVHGSWRRTAEW